MNSAINQYLDSLAIALPNQHGSPPPADFVGTAQQNNIMLAIAFDPLTGRNFRPDKITISKTTRVDESAEIIVTDYVHGKTPSDPRGTGHTRARVILKRYDGAWKIVEIKFSCSSCKYRNKKTLPGALIDMAKYIYQHALVNSALARIQLVMHMIDSRDDGFWSVAVS